MFITNKINTKKKIGFGLFYFGGLIGFLSFQVSNFIEEPELATLGVVIGAFFMIPGYIIGVMGFFEKPKPQDQSKSDP